MCKYEEIEGWRLSNGKTIREINNAVHDEVERIYLEAWSKGISVQGGRIKMRSPPKVLTGNFRPSQLSFFLS